jgi:hypothetical protein
VNRLTLDTKVYGLLWFNLTGARRNRFAEEPASVRVWLKRLALGTRGTIEHFQDFQYVAACVVRNPEDGSGLSDQYQFLGQELVNEWLREATNVSGG